MVFFAEYYCYMHTCMYVYECTNVLIDSVEFVSGVYIVSGETILHWITNKKAQPCEKLILPSQESLVASDLLSSSGTPYNCPTSTGMCPLVL